MDGVPHPTFDVSMLEDLLRDRLATFVAPTVSDVLRAFLDVATLPCHRRLWSLAFDFDEDDGRIARLVALFAPRHVGAPRADELLGLEVQLLLPRILPSGSSYSEAELDAASSAATAERLVARFLVMLTDLGAFRTIERLPLRSVTVLAAEGG